MIWFGVGNLRWSQRTDDGSRGKCSAGAQEKRRVLPSRIAGSSRSASPGLESDPMLKLIQEDTMDTTHLQLPYLAAAQAQKHVTHNEALRLLDAMVQLAVLDRTRTTPPASPADGDRHIVASGATGLWAGWDLNIAYWVDGAWTRLVPRPGWLAWIAAEAAFVGWTGTAWQALGAPVDVSDAVFSLVHDADPTKKALFNLSWLTAGTTRTYSLPNTSSEIAILAGTQTFTGRRPSPARSPPLARPRRSAPPPGRRPTASAPARPRAARPRPSTSEPAGPPDRTRSSTSARPLPVRAARR
jgi:hypothetical protein